MNGYTLTYNSQPHGAAGTATGVFGENLGADLSLSGTMHISASTYASDSWSFHDPAGNYADASGTISDVINRRDLYATANANSKSYGQTATDTGTLAGVQGNDGITPSFLSTGDSASAAVGTGSYLITATLSDPNDVLGNYTVHTTTATLTVSPASAIINVNGYASELRGRDLDVAGLSTSARK